MEDQTIGGFLLLHNTTEKNMGIYPRSEQGVNLQPQCLHRPGNKHPDCTVTVCVNEFYLCYIKFHLIDIAFSHK